MTLALEHAQKGFGHTFPNPAVGCVLVRQDTNQVIGAGFHPRAGYPHAEVFALLEAAGHVESGVTAAQAVVVAHKRKTLNARTNDKDTDGSDNSQQQEEQHELLETVQRLTETYASEGGPQELFGSDKFTLDNLEGNDTPVPVTAYVTLEPCCHTGKTPPCAASLVAAKVISRVVVGFRDPNPRVDGGGVRLLQDAGINVDMMADSSANSEDDNNNNCHEEAVKAHQGCTQIVTDFVKRITPRSPEQTDYSYINGSMRRALRSHAGRKKADRSLSEVDWNGESVDPEQGGDLDSAMQSLPLDPTWLERVDHVLWEHELVLLRLNKAIKKSKGAKLLGERIAEQLQAHVAQTVGHTALLYRPGIPPVLDLVTLGDSNDDGDDDGNN